MADFKFAIGGVAVAVLALMADPVFAQKADRPAIQAGDEWRFVHYWGMPSTEPNRIWKIHSVTPKEIEGTENGEPLTLTPDLGVLDSPRARDSNPMKRRTGMPPPRGRS